MTPLEYSIAQTIFYAERGGHRSYSIEGEEHLLHSFLRNGL